MKPYGRDKYVHGSHICGRPWKIDYHIHEKGRKVGNWWEELSEDPVPRSTMKQNLRKEICWILKQEQK